MGRLDDENKKKMINAWRVRTGNMAFKGLHRDSKTLMAEEWMRRKPYETKREILVDGGHA